MNKIPRHEYTSEFKAQAVKRAQEVGVGSAARELGFVEQTLRNWVKAAAAGKLIAAGAKPLTAEQMELFAAAAGDLAAEDVTYPVTDRPGHSASVISSLWRQRWPSKRIQRGDVLDAVASRNAETLVNFLCGPVSGGPDARPTYSSM